MKSAFTLSGNENSIPRCFDHCREKKIIKELQAEVKKYFLTFDDIIEKFPDATKRELFVAAETTDLAIAVKGLDQEVVDAIIDMLPQKKQAMYEPYEGPISKKEVDAKRKDFLDRAKEMDKEGTISIEDILGGGEMIE